MINRKPDRVQLGNDVFYIQRFPPFRALFVLGEAQKILGPVLSGMGTGFAIGAAENMEADVKSLAALFPALTGGIERLAEHMDGEKLEALARLLLDPDYVAVAPNKKQAVRLDEDTAIAVFEGRPLDMIWLMVQVFRVNYMDFSRSCSIPAGVRNALQDVTGAFRGLTRKTSDGTPTSTDASKKGS